MNIRPFSHVSRFFLFWTVFLAVLPAFAAENLVKDGTFTGSYKSTTSGGGLYIIWGPNSSASGFLDSAETTWAYSTTDLNGTAKTFGYYVKPTTNWTGTRPSTGGAVGIQVYQEAGIGTISQSISGLESGKIYIASYEYNARQGNTVSITSSFTGNSEIVLQKATSVTNPQTGQTPAAYKTYTGAFVADSDSGTLKISHVSNSAADKTLFVGNVSLTLSPTQRVFNLVQDGSFENGTYNYASGRGQYVIWGSDSAPSGNFEANGLWKYSTTTATGASSQSGYYLRPTANEWMTTIPDGKYAATLQSYALGVTSSLYQEIETTAGKQYAVAFQYNARSKNDVIPVLNVAVEGTTTGTKQTLLNNQSVKYNSASNYSFSGTFQATDATTKLIFSNIIETGATQTDRGVSFDKVQMVEIPTKVVEAGGTLVHALDLLTVKDGAYSKTGKTVVPYTYDASPALSGKLFDRVGYYVELMDQSGKLSYALISMDRFSENVSDLGIPTGNPILERVTNLTVESNVAGLSRSLATGGSIEFSRSDYSTGAYGKYDSWDTGFTNGTGYGSWQIHDAASNTPIFSFCGWSRSDGSAGAGLGKYSGNPDWTFSNSISNGSYVVANVYTYIHESDAVLTFTGDHFFQRNADGTAQVTLTGSWEEIANGVVSTVQISADDGKTWTQVTTDVANQTFTSDALTLETGWHDFQIRALDAQGNVVTTLGTDSIGVGDVLVAAGKTPSSSSTGETWATSGQVVTFDLATGKISWTGGKTPWATVGQDVAKTISGDVPVAIVNATTDDQTKALALLESALEELDGEKSILWLQDGTTVTADQLKAKIEENSDVSWVLGGTSEQAMSEMLKLSGSLENAYNGPLSSMYSTMESLGHAWGFSTLTGPYQIPEPSTLALFFLGLGFLFYFRKH